MATIAMVLGPEFEDSEYRVPYERLTHGGHVVKLIGTQAGQQVSGKRGDEKATIELAAGDADPNQYDAMVIPGGHSPDNLRTDEKIVDFVRRFAETGKTLAAVCHGPQLLIEAGAVNGKKMTSWPSVKTDLKNAGAEWVDEPVVVDGSLITSRKPKDLESFSRAILERV